MKKKLLLLIILLIPFYINAETISAGTPYGTYTDAQNMIKEAMKDYYIRGTSIQYNFPRASWYLPEAATSQDMQFFVCGTFVYQTYRLAFGILGDNLPKYQSSVEKMGNNFYQANDSRLIYYYGENGELQYPDGSTSGTMTVSDFAQYIKPGDLFDYDGHVMIAYDKVKKIDGTWDVLMLHSHQENANQGASSDDIKNYIRVRTGNNAATAKLSYNTFKNITGANTYLDLDIDDEDNDKKFYEGSIQAFWLSKQKMLVDQTNQTMQCYSDYRPCAVIRLINKSGSNAVFSFDIDTDRYTTMKQLRLSYPGLYIEKTVDKNDNNFVYLGDTLTYTIKVKNMSNTNYSNTFYLKETINDNLVSFAENYQNADNNTITFTGSKLSAGSELTFTYKVKVKYNLDNASKTITSEGLFLKNINDTNSIATGKVENTIKAKTNQKKRLNDYTTCYEQKKDSYTGRTLINEIYKCAWNVDLGLNTFAIEDVFKEIDMSNLSSLEKKGTILLLWSSSSSVETYKKMILNNYYNVFKHANDYYYHLHWPESGDKKSVQQKRPKTINSADFKAGDILIYVSHGSSYNKEDGVYAYVYLRENNNSRFTGVNYTGLEKERNLFTQNYYTSGYGGSNLSNLYGGNNRLDSNIKSSVLRFANYQTLFDKDYYIILRPELAMEDNFYYYEANQTFKRQRQGIKYSEFVDRIDTTSEITIYDKNNNILNKNENIKTGSKIKYSDNNEETVISVTGDVTGTGSISDDDVTASYNLLRQKTSSTIEDDPYEIAADTIDDENLKINDVAKLHQYVHGTINSLE